MAHYVLNNNLFGYFCKNRAFCVMAVDIEKGGDPGLINRTTTANQQKIRPATIEDYERFKIRPDGFIAK